METNKQTYRSNRTHTQNTQTINEKTKAIFSLISCCIQVVFFARRLLLLVRTCMSMVYVSKQNTFHVYFPPIPSSLLPSPTIAGISNNISVARSDWAEGKKIRRVAVWNNSENYFSSYERICVDTIRILTNFQNALNMTTALSYIFDL